MSNRKTLSFGIAIASVLVAALLFFYQQQRKPFLTSNTASGTKVSPRAAQRETDSERSTLKEETVAPARGISSLEKVPPEALESITKVEAQRLIRRLHDDNISPLEMRHWSEWLKICLADEAACRAFENWLFERSRQRPDDIKLLMSAMGGLERSAPEFYRHVVDKASAENNAALLAAALGYMKTERHPAEWLAKVAEHAIGSGNGVARFYGAMKLAKFLQPDKCEQLLGHILVNGDETIAVEWVVGYALGENGLLDAGRIKVLEDRFLRAEDPQRRYQAYVALRFSLDWGGDEQGAERVWRAIQSARRLLEYTAEGLRDPDPLVRLAAYTGYIEALSGIKETNDLIQRRARGVGATLSSNR